MPNAPTYPSENQLRVLASRIAKDAKVPADYHPDFVEHIVRTVVRLRERDRRATSAQPGGHLLEAANAARILHEKISTMNKNDREWVEHIKHSEMQFEAEDIKNLDIAILNIAAVLHSAIGKPFLVGSQPPEWHLELHKVEDQMLRELVFGLLRAAAETGGRFTFNKNSATGTLADAIDRLRPYLPKGLVPAPIPATTIQRLKIDFSRLS